jgi:arsenate reductase-like glutaredoxin family protein
MGWIKRNLFFVIVGILALGMLGAAAFYNFTSWSRNAKAVDRLNEIYTSLGNLKKKDISADNIAAAREQTQQLEQWMSQTGKYFRPIASVPGRENISDEAFANALRRTIHELQAESSAASVTLPPDYSFSFTAQRVSVKFASGSLRPLSEQLGEVKAISEILFAAHVNALDGIQRIRVSDDDAAGPQSDYIDDQPTASDLGSLTPYQITFRGFSSEIAQVLASFASSPHGFIVKGINVQPASSDTTPAAPPPNGRGGLQTVLNEQLLSIKLVVEVVKLSPGS